MGRDRQGGSAAGNTSPTSGTGSNAGQVDLGLPQTQPFPHVPPPPGVPAQDAPDRPDRLRPSGRDDGAGAPAESGPLTTSTAAGALAHGAHHIRPRPRHAG